MTCPKIEKDVYYVMDYQDVQSDEYVQIYERFLTKLPSYAKRYKIPIPQIIVINYPDSS